MKFVQVEENLLNKLLLKSLDSHNHNHNHIHIHKENESNELTPEEKRYKNILYSGMSDQVTTVYDYWNENKEDLKSTPYAVYEIEDLVDDLHGQVDNLIEKLFAEVNSTYIKGKREILNKIKRRLLRRLVDDVDLSLLRQYNMSLVDRLSFDVQEKLFLIMREASIKGYSDEYIAERFNNFMTSEQLRGYQTTATRIGLIAQGVIQASLCTGILQGMMDYNLKYANVVIGTDNPCEDCLDYYYNNPHLIKDLEGVFPMHPNCKCKVVNVPGEKASVKPVPEDEVEHVDLISSILGWL